jgi:hypothetical protein
MASQATDSNLVPPFRVHVPDEVIADLVQGVTPTPWPDRETVPDRAQASQLAKIEQLVHYWSTEYDWRRVEAQLNALPQFMTTIRRMGTA